MLGGANKVTMTGRRGIGGGGAAVALVLGELITQSGDTLITQSGDSIGISMREAA